jgi:hypothetical protein
MDLNYLFSRHQVSLMRADTAASPEARYAHRRFAALYAARIDERRHALGGAFSLGATPA